MTIIHKPPRSSNTDAQQTLPNMQLSGLKVISTVRSEYAQGSYVSQTMLRDRANQFESMFRYCEVSEDDDSYASGGRDRFEIKSKIKNDWCQPWRTIRVTVAGHLVSLCDVEDSTDGYSAEEILKWLRAATQSHESLRQAVIEAEVIAFAKEDRDEVIRILRRFVAKFRDSNDRSDLIAVCSAIRKLVAYSPGSELNSLSEVLDSTGRVSVPIEVELEIAKTIVRKLTKHADLACNIDSSLEQRLWEIAETYINPRLIGRKKYGATALNAFLALLLIRGEHACSAIELVSTSPTTWFVESARSRSRKLVDSLRTRVPEEQFADVAESLMTFLRQCETQSA